MRKAFKKLPRFFYLRPTVTVAKDLLGKYLVHKLGRKKLIGEIVEVEAYCEGDPASHSYRGITKRNEVMFGEGGHLYVYFTYGMHFCANVVTRKKGIGEAVLIRAVEPVEEVRVMRKRRGFARDDWDNRNLTNGPAKVCEAFGIARKHNGTDLCGSEIFIADSSPQSAFPARRSGFKEAGLPKSFGRRRAGGRIRNSTRIGIRNGKDKKWRFFVEGSRFVSRI